MSKLNIWNPFRRSSGIAEWRPAGTWSALRELESMHQRMEELFRDWSGAREPGESLAAVDWSPAVDITEDEKEYLVKAELPEVKKEDLKVIVEGGTLSITGERQSEMERQGRTFHRIERSYGHFERRFLLPTDADARKVTSQFKDGILEVYVAKVDGGKPKTVEVNVQ